MQRIEKNLSIIKNFDKFKLYKYLKDHILHISSTFLLVIIILFSILYFLYQYYFIQKMNYSSYINLDKLNNISYKKDLKVAVLLTGEIPNISTLITQKHFIYDTSLKPDIFCYLNNTNNNLNDEIIEILKPINPIFENKKNIDDINEDFRKVIELNKIRINYENKNNIKYDIIIRCRGDLYIKDYIPLSIINSINNNNNNIYIPSVEYHNYYSLKIGINDYFSISSPNVFNIYANFYNYLIQNKNNIKCNIIEYQLKKYLLNNKINIIKFNYDIVLYKLRTNQLNYIFIYIKQYFKKLNNKFHCILDDINDNNIIIS